MSEWLRDYLAQTAIQPLLADIRSGRIRPSVVLYAIQQLTTDEREEMKPALDLVIEALRAVTNDEKDDSEP